MSSISIKTPPAPVTTALRETPRRAPLRTDNPDAFIGRKKALPQPPPATATDAARVRVGRAITAKQVEAALPAQPLDRSFSNPHVFNADFYLSHNPDLRKAGLTTPAQLEEHWLTFGVREGRVGSPTFDTSWCKAQYGADFPDAVRTPEQTIRSWNGLSVEQKAQVKTSALTADVPYGSRGLSFDLYAPPKGVSGDKKVPVVISFVGGGYQFADNKHPVQQETGTIFAAQGIAVISPKYSVVPAPYPTPQLDAQELLRYVKDHAVENNWDVDNITLMGGSAGGHLVLDVATNPAFRDETLPHVKGVISMAAPGRAMPIPGFIGADQVEQASPVNNIPGNAAIKNTRFFVAYADDDQIIPANTVTPLIETLERAGLDLTVDHHPTGGHGDWLHPEDANPSFDRSYQLLMASWVLKG